MSNRTYPHGQRTTAAELEKLHGVPDVALMAASAGGANICEVSIIWKDINGETILRPPAFWVWLSDDPLGRGLSTATISGTVTAKTGEGAVLGVGTAKLCHLCQPPADGEFILEITATGKPGLYVVAQNPVTGERYVETVTATTDYGS